MRQAVLRVQKRAQVFEGKIMKCLVKGCVNDSVQGRHVDVLTSEHVKMVICQPCFMMLLQGRIPTQGTSFLHDIREKADAVTRGADQIQNRLDRKLPLDEFKWTDGNLQPNLLGFFLHDVRDLSRAIRGPEAPTATERDQLINALERMVSLRHGTPTSEVSSAIDDAVDLLRRVKNEGKT